MYSLCLVGPCCSSFCFLCCVVFLFCFVFLVLCLVCPQLPVCLDCPFLIVIWFSITYISSSSQICFLTFSEILLFIFAFVFCLFFTSVYLDINLTIHRLSAVETCAIYKHTKQHICLIFRFIYGIWYNVMHTIWFDFHLSIKIIAIRFETSDSLAWLNRRRNSAQLAMSGGMLQTVKSF